MSDPSQDQASRDRSIDLICTRFERAWLNGERPRIEDCFVASAIDESGVLLRELMLAELFQRRRLGEAPQAEEYSVRFPDIGLSWFAEILSEAAAQAAEPRVLPAKVLDAGSSKRIT